MSTPSQQNIEKTILENYIEYQFFFVEFQSKFLLSLYSRYQSVESGNLVLYFAKETHQNILRKRDYDFNFDISFEKFWENHSQINPQRVSIIKIGEDTHLPKETARRKILQLIKQKVLNKKNRNIGWLPSEQYKQSYNSIAGNEIENVGKLTSFICEKINLSVFKKEITEEIQKKFSYYWFHYLGAQLEYLKLWRKQLNDLELGLIFLQIAHVFTAKIKEKNISHEDLYNDPSLLKGFISASVSATSVSDTTTIPIATCVRKLEILVQLKLISKDQITKRYYMNFALDSLISQTIKKKMVKIFSNFFFICIRGVKS